MLKAERKQRVYEMITDQWINIVMANVKQEEQMRLFSEEMQEDQSQELLNTKSNITYDDSQIEKLTEKVDSEQLKDQIFKSIVKHDP